MQGQRIVREIYLFKALGQADHGYPAVKIQAPQGRNGGGKLSFATIDHHELWQLLPFIAQAAVTALHDFIHGSEIVRTFHGPDMEFAVILFGRPAFAEAGHGRHRLRTLEVGIVETFNVLGKLLQPKVLLQLPEYPQLPVGRFGSPAVAFLFII